MIYDVSKNGDGVHWDHVLHDDDLRDDDGLECIPWLGMEHVFQRGKLGEDKCKMWAFLKENLN